MNSLQPATPNRNNPLPCGTVSVQPPNAQSPTSILLVSRGAASNAPRDKQDTCLTFAASVTLFLVIFTCLVISPAHASAENPNDANAPAIELKQSSSYNAPKTSPLRAEYNKLQAERVAACKTAMEASGKQDISKLQMLRANYKPRYDALLQKAISAREFDLVNDIKTEMGDAATAAPAVSSGLSAGRQWTITLSDGVKMVFQPIPAGNFTMGSPKTEKDRKSRGEEESQHSVTISRPFWLGRTEVTQAQWEAVMGNNPSYFRGKNRPVEKVSWSAAVEFCRKLTEQERASGRLPEGYVYTLPTEAQWEYACRAGTMTPFHFGSILDDAHANIKGTEPYRASAKGGNLGQTTDVASYPPNAWGLYDMHGNVWEWCLDWFADYSLGAQTDPRGPDSGSKRIFRGGSWRGHAARNCRSAARGHSPPSNSNLDLGLRVALVPK